MGDHAVDLSRVVTFGASVAGPRHRFRREPNQDAWARLSGRAYGGVAVADGLGSAPQSRLGARLACHAVRLTLRGWGGAAADLDGVGSRIEEVWRDLLASENVLPRHARSTCLFGVVGRGGDAVLGQLGDGLVVAAGDATPLSARQSGFANETEALGSRAEWTMGRYRFPECGPLLLATDGVSDDLVPGSEAAFARHVVGSYGPLPPTQRWRRLATDLRRWPVPNHLDDKTVASVSIRP